MEFTEDSTLNVAEVPSGSTLALEGRAKPMTASPKKNYPPEKVLFGLHIIFVTGDHTSSCEKSWLQCVRSFALVEPRQSSHRFSLFKGF